MKRIILITFSVVAFLFQMNAQTNITFQINHKLGDDNFYLNQGAYNNIDHLFNVSRLEYYISEISILHDGGNETMVNDLWILAKASKPTVVDLGDYDIASIEGIKLHIGVDPEHNHLDPSSYDASHPLAPKFPAMHWGWTAGYRFVAIEGFGGDNLNQIYQLHGLGDVNYFSTVINLDLAAENGQIAIEIDADYTRALENISLNSGVIVHGDDLQAKQCLENFRDFVFSSAAISSSTIDFNEVNTFSTFPNPVSNGVANIKLDLDHVDFDYDVTITSIEGKQLQYIRLVRDGQQIDCSNMASGMYFVNLIKDGHIIITNKMFVK